MDYYIKLTETEINDVIKETLKFMIKNKIMVTPSNYEKWFNIFFNLKLQNIDTKNLSPLELLGIYKEKYAEDPFKEIQKEKIVNLGEDKLPIKIVKDVINQTDDVLINTLNKLDEHEKILRKGENEFKECEDKEMLLKILDKVVTNYDLLKEEIYQQHQKLEEMKMELEKAREEAQIDPLTGLLNRKEFEKRLKEFCLNKIPFSLILIDVDNFKKINDNYGHPAGDKVLEIVGKILKQSLREKTPIFRIGGEEFAVLLPEKNLEIASRIAERLRKIFENRIIRFDDNSIYITVTLSVTYSEGTENPKEVYKRADDLLYKGKKEGKNKVIL